MTPSRDLLRAVRAGRGRAAVRPRPSRFRFPCGHLDGWRAVSRRLRTSERAVWVRCRSCSVVALVVARAGTSG